LIVRNFHSKTVACALFLIFGAASSVQAQAADCDDAMTQMEMNDCAAEEFAAADADLNAAYQEARAAMQQIDRNLDASQRGAESALRAAQRAWISFRDAACAAEGFQMRGGSAEPLVIYGCLSRLSEQRAQDLWDIAAGLDG
jgi:uncharacterized protein YecT (DUF1311 family)